MKRAQVLLAILFGTLVAAYLLGFIHPFGNLALGSPSGSPRAWGQVAMPSGVHSILAAKCGDCHSLQIRTPIYAHFAPASWLIERDIVRARSEMNLSQWDVESPDDRQLLVAKIAHVANKREMPPLQYLALHWSARLTSDDVHAIAEWAQSGAPASERSQGGAAPQGDAVRGKAIFEKRCTGCHALEQNREGPHLKGVYMRPAGTVRGFDYSDALKNSHIVWSEATLERWLTDPQTMVPGANMDFYVAKPGERADVIEFLKQQSEK